MYTRGSLTLAAATALLCTSAADCLAQGPLAGVRAVSVLIEPLDAEATKISLHESDLRTQVELKLRMAGLRVVPPTAGQSLPFLYVQVAVQPVAVAEGLYVYHVQTAAYEFVELPRNKERVPGQLWIDGTFGNVGLEHAREAIVAAVGRRVDSFLNDWLAANPK